MRALRQRRVTGKSLRRQHLRARRQSGSRAVTRKTRPARPNLLLSLLWDGVVGLWANQVLFVEIVTLAVIAALFFGLPLFPVSPLTVLAGFVVLYWLLALLVWRFKLWVWWLGRVTKGEWYVLEDTRTLDRIALGDKADKGDWGQGA
jgi:hypothetical protein